MALLVLLEKSDQPASPVPMPILVPSTLPMHYQRVGLQKLMVDLFKILLQANLIIVSI
jgi:hypothetical protein